MLRLERLPLLLWSPSRSPVVHDGFEPGSGILPGVSEGWPRILSDLKTLLETGDTLVLTSADGSRCGQL